MKTHSLKSLLGAAACCLSISSGFGASFDIGPLDSNPEPFKTTGSVVDSEPTDTYEFEVASACTVELSLSGLSGNANLKLVAASGKVLASSSKKKTKSESIEKPLQPGRYRAVVQSADKAPASYTFQASAVFNPDDIVASGDIAIQDPEYDAASLKAAWREGTTLYATGIDPETGKLDIRHREVVDTGLATITEVVNGPEWSSVSGGQPRIIYTKSSGGVWSISQAREKTSDLSEPPGLSEAARKKKPPVPSQNWLIQSVPGTENGYIPIGSQDGDESAPLMKYTIGTRSDRDQGSAWKQLDSPFQGGLLPSGATAGRFVPGENAMIYSRMTQDFYQLTWYDLGSGEETILTDTPIHKALPFAVHAPEFGGDVVITAAETGNAQDRGFYDSIGIYRQVNGKWTLIKRIKSPSETLRGVHSIEPFVFDGKSYVSFLVLKAIARDDGTRKENAEVWIASVDPDDNFLRKVSGSAGLTRSDPESLVTENEVFIYYTEIAKKTYRQHRAKTGLGKP